MKKLKSGKWLIGFMVVSLSLGIMSILNHQGAIQAKDSDDEVTSPKIPMEVISKRTIYSKTFDNGDGTFTLKTHLAPIHYQNKGTGQFEPIDLNIIRASKIPLAAQSIAEVAGAVSPEVYAFSDEKNIIRSYFKEKSTEGNLFRAEVGDHYITWQLLSIKWVDLEGNTEKISDVQDTDGISQENKIIYSNIFQNVDEEFEIMPGKIKDNIILKSPPAMPVITPDNVTNLVIEGILQISPGLKIIVDGIDQIENFETASEIELRDTQDKSIMFIHKPYVYDSNKHVDESAIYEINFNGDELIFRIKINKSWVFSKDTIYPITIDPTVSKNFLYDSFITSGCNATNYGSNNCIYVGYNAGTINCPNDNWRQAWGLVGYGGTSPVSSCIPSSNISSAGLNLRVWALGSQGSPPPIEPLRITSSWTEDLVTELTLPNYTSDSNELRIPSISSNHWETWNVTNSVRKWHDSYDFYGFALQPIPDITGDNFVSFYSSEGGYTAYLSIDYSAQCSSGDCCDISTGCYLPSSSICSSTTEYGCPWGTSPGNDVGSRSVTQYCSGSSSSCDGSILYGSWGLEDSCTSTEVCVPKNPECQPGCECTSGSCCDICNYRPSSYKCQEDVNTEYGCPWGTDPGDGVGVRHQDRYCSGSSASCNGTLQWDSWIIHTDCNSNEKCEEGKPTCVLIPEEDGDEENGGCQCSSIGNYKPIDKYEMAGWLLPFLMIAPFLLVLKIKLRKKSNNLS